MWHRWSGGTWNRDGTILFSSYGQALKRVAASGGEATPVTTLDESREERMHAFPVFLADGQRFLYVAQNNVPRRTAVYQGGLDATDVRRVFGAESNIGLAGKDHPVAHQASADRSELRCRIDARVSGASITIAEQLTHDTALRSGGAFSVAPAWFATGGRVRKPPDLVRSQRQSDRFLPRGWRLSSSVAVARRTSGGGRENRSYDGQAHDLDSRRLARNHVEAAVGSGGAHRPVWSPEGGRVVFTSNRLVGSTRTR